MGIGEHFRQMRQYVAVEGPADAVRLLVFQLACKQGYVCRIETQVAAEIVVDFGELLRPFRVFGIGFALVDEHTLDDAVLLGDASHLEQPLVRASVVFLYDGFHPVPL